MSSDNNKTVFVAESWNRKLLTLLLCEIPDYFTRNPILGGYFWWTKTVTYKG